MKRLFSILLVVFNVLLAIGQERPMWLSANYRNLKYPQSEYYIAYVLGEKTGNETIETAMSRLRSDARAELVSQIRVSVNHTNTHRLHSMVSTTDIDESDVYTSISKSQSSIKDIPGLVADVWYDSNLDKIHAFAYVSRSELQRKINKRITSSLAKAELTLDNAKDLIAQGEKTTAEQVLNSALNLFSDIEEDQKLLLAMDETLSAEDLSIPDAMSLYKSYTLQLADLKNGTFISIKGNVDLFGNDNAAFIQRIKGYVTSSNVALTDDDEQADWLITLSGSAREYQSPNASTYFSYVDLDISIVKRVNNRLVCSDRLSQKGGDSRSYQYAAQDAYKQLENKVVEIIKQKVK